MSSLPFQFKFQDVEWLLTQLGNVKYSNKISGYNHADFIWVINALCPRRPCIITTPDYSTLPIGDRCQREVLQPSHRNSTSTIISVIIHQTCGSHFQLPERPAIHRQQLCYLFSAMNSLLYKS